jgi:hypothetical protein
LLLRELAQEIALVFVAIDPREQPVHPVFGLFDPAVMPRGDVIGVEFQSLLQKHVELYLPVAQHVGVGRTSPFILGEHIIDHPRAVLLRKIDEIKRYIEPFCDEFGK